MTDHIEFVDAPRIEASNDPHLACVLLIDTSKSMSKCIDNLNQSIMKFKNSVCKNELSRDRVDVAVVEFNTEVNIIQHFVPISNLPNLTLKTGGRTAMGTGINAAIDLVKARCQFYNTLGTPCFKPWIFMITDGSPWGEPKQEIERARARIREEENKGRVGKLKFFAVAVDKANKDLLSTLTARVIDLKGTDFGELFNWLGDSMTMISVSTPAEEGALSSLPPSAKRYKPTD